MDHHYSRPSPWSTPRKSEYGEGFIEIFEDEDEEGFKVNDEEMLIREMGDGEPSPIDPKREEETPKVSLYKDLQLPSNISLPT